MVLSNDVLIRHVSTKNHVANAVVTWICFSISVRGRRGECLVFRSRWVHTSFVNVSMEAIPDVARWLRLRIAYRLFLAISISPKFQDDRLSAGMLSLRVRLIGLEKKTIRWLL